MRATSPPYTINRLSHRAGGRAGTNGSSVRRVTCRGVRRQLSDGKKTKNKRAEEQIGKPFCTHARTLPVHCIPFRPPGPFSVFARRWRMGLYYYTVLVCWLSVHAVLLCPPLSTPPPPRACQRPGPDHPSCFCFRDLLGGTRGTTTSITMVAAKIDFRFSGR